MVGLVAARTKERFRRPAFAFTLNADGTATGSGRSIAGVDLGSAVRAAVDDGIALKGGGHAMAAGATVLADKLPEFQAFIAARLADRVGQSLLQDHFAIDATLTAGGAQTSIVEALERAGPFGSAHPEPIFVFANHRVVEAREVGNGGHIRVKLRAETAPLSAASPFGRPVSRLGNCCADAVGGNLHIAGTLSIDRWGGGEKVGLRIMDAARPE